MGFVIPHYRVEKRRLVTMTRLIVGTLLLTFYIGGYAMLRLRHDFIRTERFETTGPWSHVVTHHDIRLGEWRYSWHYQVLYLFYWPLRIAETNIWRMCD